MLTTPILPFGSDRVEEALRLIQIEKTDYIYCSLTGVDVGYILADEVRLCLQMELHRRPLATVDDLVESFAMRQYAMSSGPAPSLRVHKDHNALVRVLKLDAAGPERLLAYLTGRLLFESLVDVREIHSTDVKRAKLSFLIEMQERMSKLPVGWSQSLTSEDEEIKPASRAVGMLSVIAGMKPSPEEEAKAAQKCLEALLRLDAIHNVKSAFYGNDMREKLSFMRDEDSWTFSEFDRLLSLVEADGIKRLNQNSMRPPQGNLMIISAAITSIGWSRARQGVGQDKLLESIEKGIDKGKIGVGTSGSQLMAIIHELLIDKQKLSKDDKRNLESALRQLKNDSESVSYSDKRLLKLHSLYGRQGERLGTHKVLHGDHATQALYDTYKDAKQAIPAALLLKMDGVKERKAEAKAIKDAKAGKTAKAPRKRTAGGVNREALLAALGGFKFGSGE